MWAWETVSRCLCVCMNACRETGKSEKFFGNKPPGCNSQQALYLPQEDIKSFNFCTDLLNTIFRDYSGNWKDSQEINDLSFKNWSGIRRPERGVVGSQWWPKNWTEPCGTQSAEPRALSRKLALQTVCQMLVLWSWENELAFPGLRFLFCKWKFISQDCGEERTKWMSIPAPLLAHRPGQALRARDFCRYWFLSVSFGRIPSLSRVYYLTITSYKSDWSWLLDMKINESESLAPPGIIKQMAHS